MLLLKRHLPGVWLMFAAMPLSGCGGGGTSAPVSTGPLTSAPRAAGSLQLALSTTKSVFARGETVPLTFIVRNMGAQKATADTQSERFAVNITQKGQDITSFPSLLEATFAEYDLDAGASASNTITWNQTMYSTQPAIGDQPLKEVQAPAGQYTITAYMPIAYLDGTNLLMNIPSANWDTFWLTNYASNPITITIR